jgi:solute carrier family 25 carnitine/acylcarnitine transporter 20/29
VKKEGLPALYKGLAGPFLAQGVYKGVIFSSNTALSSAIKTPGKPLDLWQKALCGAVAGAVNTLVVTPVELVRNRLQVQYGADGTGKQQYKGTFHCIKQIVKEKGISGMWRGLDATIWRDFWGVGLWFTCFNISLQQLTKDGEKPGTAQLLLAGASGGIGFWIAALPLDTVKSVMQVDQSGKYRHALDCGLQLVREEGVSRLFRGWQVAFARGIPGAAVVFYTHNIVLQWLG